MTSHTNVSYTNTLYSSASNSNIDIKELNIVEDWDCRPASEWSLRRMGSLQSKIEQFTYTIYHSNRYGKHNLAKVIPNYTLKQFANEAFGYDGWKMEVIEVEATECSQVAIAQSTIDRSNSSKIEADPATSLSTGQLDTLPSEDKVDTTLPKEQEFKYIVLAEAEVKITLKDGTNIKRTGVGRATMLSKGNSFSKAKKEAVGDALKKCLLGFEQIIADYDTKKQNNYFVDGLYGSKVKQDPSATSNI